MIKAHLPAWLPQASACVLVILLLGWLLFPFAGDRSGGQPLPGANSSEVDVLSNPMGTLGVSDVAKLPDASWRKWEGSGFLREGAGEPVWARVTLRNPSPTLLNGVLADRKLYSDRVDFYSRDLTNSAGWQHMASGEWVGHASRPLWGRETAFPVVVPANGERVVFLRFDDYFAVWLELEWWADQGAFHAAQSRTLLAEGWYFGALLALLLYNALLWVRVRFPDIASYLLYLGAFSAFMFFGRSQIREFGWTLGSPWMETISMVALTLSGASLWEFARTFLELSLRAPRADLLARWARDGMIVLAVIALAAPWIGRGVLAYVFFASAATHIILIVVAAIAWHAGAREARFFILAFGFLLAGLLPGLAFWLTFIPVELIGRTILIGSALEMIILSAAMADRFAQIQKDRTEAREALLEESLQRQAIQEAYADELTLEVKERTRELEILNQDKDRMITILSHDLRSPLAGLTQTAEQLANQPSSSALTQFANDAAATGRQMLLLIEDLTLWSRLNVGERGQAGRYASEALVAPVIALHEALARQIGVSLRREGTYTQEVQADVFLAQTLLRNLLTNALKVASTKVVIVAAETPMGLRLSVQNDGPSLPPDLATSLRDPTAAVPGTGLGLRLCLDISRILNWHLSAMPLSGGGTEFSFILPHAPLATNSRLSNSEAHSK